MTNKIQNKRSSTLNNPPSSLDPGEIAINTNAASANVHFEDADGDMRSIGADPTTAGTYVRDVASDGAVGTWVEVGTPDADGSYGYWTRNDTNDELTPRTAGDDVSTTGDMKAANFIIDQTTADVTVAAANPAAARTYTFPDEGGDRNITIDAAAPASTTQYVRQITDAGVGSWVEADAVPGGGDGSGDFGFWSRDDATDTLSPRTADDNLDMGAGDITTTGDISGADGTFTGNVSAVNGTFSGDVTLSGAGQNLILTGSDDTPTDRTISINAPTNDAAFTANYSLTLPPNDGDADQVLTTDGTGTLTWTTPSGGGGGASVTVSLTPPGSPDAGDLWFCADDQDDGGGRLYIYYNEGGVGGSAQWVDVSQPNSSALTQAIADGRYLSKTTADTAAGEITFEEGIVVTGGDNTQASSIVGAAAGHIEITGQAASSNIRIGFESAGGIDHSVYGVQATTSTTEENSFLFYGTLDSTCTDVSSGFAAACPAGMVADDIYGFRPVGSQWSNQSGKAVSVFYSDIAKNAGTVSYNFNQVGAGENKFEGETWFGTRETTSGTANAGNGIRVQPANGAITVWKGSGAPDGFNGASQANYIMGFAAPDASTNRTARYAVNAAGRVYSIATSNTLISSERRMKKDIELMDPTTAWDTVKSTPFYQYKYKDIESDLFCYGPMADEVPAEMVVPTENTDEQGVINTYDSGMLAGRQFVALQQALQRIEDLEARLAALEGA